MFAAPTTKTSNKLTILRTTDPKKYGAFVFVLSYQIGVPSTDCEKFEALNKHEGGASRASGGSRRCSRFRARASEDQGSDDINDNKGDKEETDGDKKRKNNGDDGDKGPRLYVFMHLAFRAEREAPVEYLTEDQLQTLSLHCIFLPCLTVYLQDMLPVSIE